MSIVLMFLNNLMSNSTIFFALYVKSLNCFDNDTSNALSLYKATILILLLIRIYGSLGF